MRHSREVANAQKRILIVDDDVRVRDLAVFAARRSELFSDVATAGDGTEATRMIWHLGRNDERAGLPDVVLTDLSMPGMDGLQFTRALKAHPQTRSIPVFMFSSSGHPNDREQALAAGCDEFFEKPISLDGLVGLMRAIGARLTQIAPRG